MVARCFSSRSFCTECSLAATALPFRIPQAKKLKPKTRPQSKVSTASRPPTIRARFRVTSLKNGKSVVVRVTDRGIPERKTKLDLCKEAAEQLEMVREGTFKVRMEILEDGALSPTGAAP